MWRESGTGSLFHGLEGVISGEGRGGTCFLYVASLCSKCCLEHCSFFVYHRITGTGVWAACVCTFVLHTLRMFHFRERGNVCDKSKACAVAGSHTLHHCTIPPPPSGLRRGMSGLWECHCAESTGGEQLLHCAACPFGRLHAAFQRGAPSAFGSVSLVDQAFACWSLTRCAHRACSSSGLWGLPIIPQ